MSPKSPGSTPPLHSDSASRSQVERQLSSLGATPPTGPDHPPATGPDHPPATNRQRDGAAASRDVPWFLLPGADAPPTAAPPRPLYPDRKRTWMKRKSRYHHGNLRAAAVQRGMAIVADRGQMAVTLRGLARELNVSAAALVYYFQNRAGLLCAIAQEAAEQLRPFSILRSGGIRAAERLRAAGEGWVTFAQENPNLYRLIFGEGWRGAMYGTLPRHHWTHSVDKIASIGQRSGHICPGRPKEHAWLLFAAVHGLATAVADRAVPAEEAPTLIRRFVAAVEVNPGAAPPSR